MDLSKIEISSNLLKTEPFDCLNLILTLKGSQVCRINFRSIFVRPLQGRAYYTTSICYKPSIPSGFEKTLENGFIKD